MPTLSAIVLLLAVVKVTPPHAGVDSFIGTFSLTTRRGLEEAPLDQEPVGQFKNPGPTWCQEAEKLNDHDFLTDAAGRAAPYGVYDPERNEGHVCVTMSSDTADFAVDAIIDWWRLSQPNYPQAKRLMIEADSGGSNAARSRRYKVTKAEFNAPVRSAGTIIGDGRLAFGLDDGCLVVLQCSSRTKSSRPPRLSPTSQASVLLPPGDDIVLAGGRGQARIRVGYRSAGQRLWDALCRTFHFEM